MANRQEQLAYVLVGDHLGQVKKVLPDSGELSLLSGFAKPDSSNPVVSIEPIGTDSSSGRQLVANRNGQLYIYNGVRDKTKACIKAEANLNKALPIKDKQILLIYDKQIILDGHGQLVKHKRGDIKNAAVHDDNLAIVGVDLPLRIFDIQKRSKLFEADPPEKNWLGIKPDVHVADLAFVAQTRVATCSKSDSVIRIYDTKAKPKPVILIDIDQTAFNEHADSSRFTSVASTGDTGHTIVVGSNVGQILAIDLRFNVKVNPKKKLQPKTSKILGGFKGPRGATIKDLMIVPATGSDDKGDDYSYKVISCCLDRYLRIHNFTRNSRCLDKHVYMNTKPLCCSAQMMMKM